jgi:hypothetical protein
MTVRDPHGRSWKVSRRVLPWRPRWRAWDYDALWPDITDGIGGFVLGIFLFFLSLIALLLGPCLILIVEWTAALVATPFNVMMRLPVKRWVVDARWRKRRQRARIDWRVEGGFGRAGEVAREAADGIRQGNFGVAPAGTLRVDHGVDQIGTGFDPLMFETPN